MARRRAPRRLLTAEQRRDIHRLARQGRSEREIVEQLGVSKGSIWRTLRPRPAVVRAEWQPRAGRLRLAQRIEIDLGVRQGLTFTAIATQLGVHVSTVSREVGGRGSRCTYTALAAHRRARRRTRRPKPSKLQLNRVLRDRVLADLDVWWSPQQIAARLRDEFPDDPEMRVSHETIYRSLFVQGKGALRQEVAACLRSGRAARRSGFVRTRSGVLEGVVPISERPAEVQDRAVPGHWEGDLIFGSSHRHPIGTLVERQTRFVILFRPERYSAEAVRLAMQEAIQTLPRELFRSLTWDRGAEMARHQQFTIDTGIQVFFCDPHSPWQRGTNENTNGLLRQYFPKGSDFSQITDMQLNAAAASLNNRPRQTLNWRKPTEALTQLLALTA